MRRIMSLAAGIVLVAAGSAAGQESYRVTTQRRGPEVITIIERIVVAPPVKEGKAVKAVKATSTAFTLKAKDWRGGRFFSDDSDRRWCLVYGSALDKGPAEVRGWVIRTVADRLLFVTEAGAVFRQVEK